MNKLRPTIHQPQPAWQPRKPSLQWHGLIADREGLVSHTKLWNNITDFVATLAFIYQVIDAGLTPLLLVVYMAVVGTVQIASKLLILIYGGRVSTTNEEKQNVEPK